jgi:hypothetical protein
MFGRPAFEGPLLLGRRVRLAQAAPQQIYPGQPAPSDPSEALAEQGAIVQVQVGQPGAAGGGSPQTLQAMIDSGASISGITVQAAQSLGLQAVGSTQLGGVGGTSQAPIYAAALTIPQFNVKVDPLQIAGVTSGLPVDMLIGRDLIKNAGLIFTYYGLKGNFTLTPDAGGAPAHGAEGPLGIPIPISGQSATGAAQPGQPSAPPKPALPQPSPSGGFPTTPVIVGAGAAALTAAAFLLKIF